MRNKDIDKLTLYYRPTCSYCIRVIKTLERLNINAERLDTSINVNHLNDLVAKRNRATVPVLRIYYKDGRQEWMPESRDIIKFLEANHL